MRFEIKLRIVTDDGDVIDDQEVLTLDKGDSRLEALGPVARRGQAAARPPATAAGGRSGQELRRPPSTLRGLPAPAAVQGALQLGVP